MAEARAGQERRPARVAGAYVVMVGDEPVLYVERGGRGLLADAPREVVAGVGAARRRLQALRALAEAVRAGRVGKLALERIDGEPAIASRAGGDAGRAGLPLRPAQAHAQRLSLRARRRAVMPRRSSSAVSPAALVWHRGGDGRAFAHAPLRVGHKGAALLAPGNTLASFRAALEAGVDMIEFDVLSEHPDGSGRLLLAHDYEALHDAHRRSRFEQALAHLAGEEFAGVELDVDVKLPGYEPRVVAALREAGLIERSLVSGMFSTSSTRCARCEPALRLGWSVPRVRRDYTTDMLTAIPALAILTGYRALLPRRVRAALSAGRFDAIMAHWRLVTPRARARGGRRRRRAVRLDGRRRARSPS